MLTFRKAQLEDVDEIRRFVDYWLSGRGMREHAPGAINDFFVSHGQHVSYLQRSIVIIALDNEQIVGWAVKHSNGTLIHLLVAGTHRKQGIGKMLLKIIDPELIHSKSTQSTGNPLQYYLRRGYVKIGAKTSRPSNRRPTIRKEPLLNIDVLAKKTT